MTAILDLQLKATSGAVTCSKVVSGTPENMGIAVGISLIAALEPLTRSKLREGHKLLKFSPRAPTTPLSAYFVILIWDLPRSICVPNLKFLASCLQNLRKGSRMYSVHIWHLNTHHTPLGVVVINELWHVIYLYTKFELSICACSKFTKGGPQFTNLDLWPLTRSYWEILSFFSKFSMVAAAKLSLFLVTSLNMSSLECTKFQCCGASRQCLASRQRRDAIFTASASASNPSA